MLIFDTPVSTFGDKYRKQDFGTMVACGAITDYDGALRLVKDEKECSQVTSIRELMDGLLEQKFNLSDFDYIMWFNK